MIESRMTTPFIVKVLTETVNDKKIVVKTWVDSIVYKCAFVVLSQTRLFENDKDSVGASCMIYCLDNVTVKQRDVVVVDSKSYEVVSVIPNLRKNHKEVYLSV